MPLVENLISQATVERLGWMLVHCLWQATAVALLLAGTLRLLRRADANRRYVAACAALTLMVAAPVVTIRLIRSTGPVAEPGSVPAIQPATLPTSPWTDQAVAEASGLAEPLTMSDITAPAPTLSWRERMACAVRPTLPYTVFGWLLGVFGLSAWHLGGWAQLQRIKRRMVQQVGPTLRNKAEHLGARLGVRRGVALLESALVEVPTVVGWMRPAILLPASALTGLSPDQLEAILAHELAHVRRYDYLVNVLQTVVEILGFYHPAVWWVSRRIRIERENCCDDLAVRVCGDSLQYARALTCMEEIRHRRTEWAVAATGGSLFARIARVLGRPAVDDQRFAWLPGLLTLALITALLIPTAFVLGAAGPQQTNDSSNGMVVEDVNAGSNLPEAQPADGVKVQVQTDANDADAASAAEKASVLLEFTIAEVQNDAALDRETTLQVLNILGKTAQAAAPDATQPLTAHEVLRKYVAGRQLPPETVQTLLDLLCARGYLQIETNPQVMTRDGAKASIRVGTEVPIPVPAQNGDTSPTTMENVECGTAIRVTPHVDRPDAVTLEMAVELTSVLPTPQPQQTPRVRRRALESTLTLSTDRCFSLLMEPQPDEANETQAEAPVLVMVKPSVVASQAAHMTKEDGTPQHPANVRQRQVLLDARVVAVERGNLLNLGVEWGWPKLHAGFNYDGTGSGDVGSNKALARGPMTGIRVGYTSGQEFTDSLLAALDLLQENGQADILSNPRILAQDGRQSRLKVVTEEYFMMAPPTPGQSSPAVWELQQVETGTTLTVTPHIGDHNDMTLEMAIEVSDSVPHRGGRGLPVVTRRIARNAVTIEDGGTVIVAGLTESRSRSQGMRVPVLSDLPLIGALFRTSNKDTTPREVAIFVTAHLVDACEVDTPPASKPAEATVRIPPATDAAGRTPGSVVPSDPTPPAGSEQQPSPAIAVAVRVMTPGARFLKDLQGSSRIKGVTSPQDTQALHETGRMMSEGKLLLLDEEQVSLLIEAMRTYPDCRALAAPRFTVREGEPGYVGIGDKVPYIAGYSEPNEPAGAPQASRRTLDCGLNFQMVARAAGPDAVALDAALRITTLLGFENKKYRGRYPYQVPRTEETTLPLEHLVVPSGQTAVLLGPKARPKASDKPEAVLLLVKPSLVPPPTAETQQGKEEPGKPAISTKGNLIQLLADLSQRTRAKIMTDATVKPTPVALDFDPTSLPVADALQRILRDTDYRFRMVGDNAYLVYRPITCLYAGRDLREALQDLGVAAGVPIIPDVNVAGRVYADIREQPVEKALEILLAGTPYMVKRRPEYYLVTERTLPSFSPLDRETRSIRLTRITPERAKRLVSTDMAPYVTVEPVDPNNRRHILVTAPHSLVDQIVADIQRIDTRPRQALLDMRVVVMKHSDLLDLAIEWAAPADSGDPSPDSTSAHNAKTGAGTMNTIRIGCLSGRTATTRMLESLNRLCEERQASIPWSPQNLVQDGRTSQFKPFSDDGWFREPGGWSGTEDQAARAEAERIAPEAVLSLTPHIPDGNEITLDMSLELSESIPKEGSSLPTVIRHVVKNAVKLDDGSTLVWAGLRRNGIEQQRRAPTFGDPLLGPLFRKNAKDEPRELVIFVTAHLIRDALSTE